MTTMQRVARGDTVSAPCSSCLADLNARTTHRVRSSTKSGVVLHCGRCGTDSLFTPQQIARLIDDERNPR